MKTKTTAVLIVACLLGGGAFSATAAPLKHRSGPEHWTAGRHVLTGKHARARASYSAPYAYGLQPFSRAEERWFDQAKGNIW
jgi:hypothetical protein